ncbi:hypothetical protein NA78x_006224 [Anatilimnocola sp. NA78]|uniref:hypothetical protein n=1 Tax=Anatilimnocola sp. NA78 TaxID=3415683 RepID=UPI003CE54F61
MKPSFRLSLLELFFLMTLMALACAAMISASSTARAIVAAVGAGLACVCIVAACSPRSPWRWTATAALAGAVLFFNVFDSLQLYSLIDYLIPFGQKPGEPSYLSNYRYEIAKLLGSTFFGGVLAFVTRSLNGSEHPTESVVRRTET